MISYGRLVSDADLDYYVSIDPFKVGEQQGKALLEALEGAGKSSPSVAMINGSPTDSNAAPYKKGAHCVLDARRRQDRQGVRHARLEPRQGPARDGAGDHRAGKDGFDGVYVANDGMAGGAIAAIKGAGIDPASRSVTGQDAEVAGVQRILAGEQFMTVYKADQARAPRPPPSWPSPLAQGKKPPATSPSSSSTTA